MLYLSLIIAVMSFQASSSLLIDDFNDGDSVSSLGTRWSFFTDGVMGGLSKGEAVLVDTENGKALNLVGDVSLKNNGGFIQAALNLQNGSSFDAREFSGIRIVVKGNGQQYFLHIRTTQNLAPWHYFYAQFETTDQWTTIDIPFSSFKHEGPASNLDKSNLRRVALVAAKEAMQANLLVSEISFY